MDSRVPWTAERSHGEFRLLLPMLRGFGIEPDSLQRFAQVEVLAPAGPAVTPGSLLGLDDAQILSLAEQRAGVHVLGHAIGLELNALKQACRAEAQAVMAGEVDDYIRQLRPAFDAAAGLAKACATAGVTPQDTPEKVMERGAAASAAWLSLTRTAAPQLDKIASVRIQMSAALGVFPVHEYSAGPPIDYSACFTLPYTPDYNLYDGWRRWLHLAPNLHLTTSDEITSKARAGALQRAA